MADKNKTVSFRIEEDEHEELQELSDELDASVSDILRDHVEGLVEDEKYREVHVEFYDDGRSFEEFVHEEELFDTKWIDETRVDYDKMLEKFTDVVKDAQRENFTEAYSTIDELDENGYEQEAFLLNTVVSEYKD